MSSQLQQISTLCAELRSEKPPTRNKAAERMETILISAKDELMEYERIRGKSNNDNIWLEIFSSTVEATLKHAAKVVELKEQKSIQAMLNKNHVYRSVIHKLIDYNLENTKNILPKSVFYQAFCDGFSTTSAVKIFGSLFLQILERGIYKCPSYIRELKVDEYKGILSCLFELSIPGDEILHFEVLSCIVKTIELAVQYVHIQDEIIEYLPEILPFARRANDDRKKADVIKLYYFFISQLAIDYHHTVCESLQDIVPILCDIYNVQLKPEIKEIFFISIHSSIHAIYPDINNGSFKTIEITIKDSWQKTINKLKSILDLEIRERRMTIQRSNQSGFEKFLEQFIETASVIVYVLFWHVNDKPVVPADDEPMTKIAKAADKLDVVLRLVQYDKTFNEIWFAILGSLLSNQHNVINLANYQELLQVISTVLNISSNAMTWRSIRRCLDSILIFEENHISNQNKAYATCCTPIWNKIVNFLISESSETNDIIKEKLLLLQCLIKQGKLTSELSNILIKSIITNSILRRDEAFETIRQILIHADICGIDKNSDTIEKIISWAYEVNDKINARSILLNIAPVDIKLINDTCAIAVTNFLNQHQLFRSFQQQNDIRIHQLNILQYKYNIKLVCLEEHGKLLRTKQQQLIQPSCNIAKVLNNCLFQNTYELLMRTVNIEISKETSCSSVVRDMTSLYKLADLLKAFLYYEVFTKQNLNQCPLIKRVGFFLSHMESQLKSNDPRSIERIALMEILQHLEPVVKTFTSNPILTQFLETQPLEELVNFLGASLSHSASQHVRNKISDWADIRFISLRILAELCAISTYQKDAFHHISRYVFNIGHDLDILLPLIKIFCAQKRRNSDEDCEIGEWFIEKLKLIFRMYYKDLQIIDKLVEMLPEIFEYVYSNNELLNAMFVALTSLLKIAYKKNYSASITSKLMKSVSRISRQCGGIWTNESFINICISAMKFLSIPSLQIQFSVISTVTSLMDADWLKSSTQSQASFYANAHYNMCQELFSAINWKGLSEATTDLTQNRNSIVLQLLLALLAFSSYYQEHALMELANCYASKKISEGDLKELTQICDFFHCSRTGLTKPYINNLITAWIANKWPILKYPYFLCYSNKDDFIRENISIIAAATVLYVPNADFKKFNKYATDEELLKHALPILQAFILPQTAQCPEAQTEKYKRYFEILKENASQLKLNLKQSRETDSNVCWKTLYICYNHLKVDEHAVESFKFPSLHVTSSWYHLSYNSLIRCLSFYLLDQSICDKDEPKAFFAPICNNPLEFLKVLAALKADIYSCLFLNGIMAHFYKYCAAVDMITDSIPSHISNKRHKNIAEYFIRDGILFITQFLQKVQHTEMHEAACMFLQHLFEKPYLSVGEGKKVINDHLNEITKCLIVLAHNNNTSLKLLNNLIVEFGKNTMVFYKFPETDNFKELRETQNISKTSPSNIKDLFKILESSMLIQKSDNGNLGAIRQYVVKHKEELSTEGEFFCDLVHQLLEVVCHADNTNLRLEAAKCLGEIGSLDISNATFYFQTQSAFYDNVSSTRDKIELFSICLAKTLDKMLMRFEANAYKALFKVAVELINTKYGRTVVSSTKDKIELFSICLAKTLTKMLMRFEANTYKALFKVAVELINTKYGRTVVELFPQLAIFQTLNKEKQYWDPRIDIDSINWLFTLSSTESLAWNKWICAFVSQIFSSCGWSTLSDLANRDQFFANEIILPFIMLLMTNKEVHIENIMTMLQYYFKELHSVLEKGTSNQLSSQEIYKDKRIIRMFLNICECVRINNECSVHMNLLHVATASNYCQAYFMSIMYTELWALSERNKQTKSEEILKSSMFQEISTKAYKSIGCFDAIPGFLSPLQSRLEFLTLNNDWSEMLLQNSFTNATTNHLCTSALKRNGILCLGDLGNKKFENSVDYEICWRLCQWDMPVEGHLKVNIENDPELEFKKHHFNALKCLHNREQQNCLAAIENARQCVIHNFMGISTECLQSVYKYLTWLHILQQAEDFCQVQFIPEEDIKTIFSKWKLENKLKYGSFYCKELALSHQITLFNTAGVRGQRRIHDFFKYSPIETCLLNIIKECKKSGEINLAKRNILALRETEISNEHVKLNSLLEDAEINFRCGNIEITEALLKHALTHKDLGACPQQARALRMYGEFLLETNSQSFEYVLEKMFNRSIFYLEKIFKSQKYNENDDLSFLYLEDLKPAEFENENKKEAYQIISKYADREYVQSNMYINSEEFKLKCQIIEQNRQTADSIDRQNKDRDVNHGVIIMKRYANLDETDIKVVEERRTSNLCIAVKNYIKLCEIDSGFSNGEIYRIISLWFANKQVQELHKEITDNIYSIPSYKLICALNQITARLSSTNSNFVLAIKDILVRCLQDHPHHTLYQLYPLIFDDNGCKSTKTRSTIASEIITKGRNTLNAQCAKQLAMIFPALIQYASAECKKGASMPLSDKLKRMRNLDAVQCPTIDLPIMPSKDYIITSIIKWEERVSLVGGINAPKKLVCQCSDGKFRPQLLKGRDDLRQDAVMQQYFALINTLLCCDPKTSERKLSIRTYKVVPLSMRSGILEWCENTLPIADYLGSGSDVAGAHKKYRPNDFTPNKCRQTSMAHLKSDPQKRLLIYEQLCGQIKPVFHYFLLEKFVIPGVWFERRLAYTNSLAANSMVGFVVGLGDRHTKNILIDEKTAEVVNIDFGIAFEQGKIMPTPETVPFRLTRDMVAPLGICETGGLFKKSCQATLEVLRKNHSVIITILEVLLYDPLYIWNVVPSPAGTKVINDEKNLTAQRALLCVQHKLEGRLSSITGTVNTDVQVQRLINDAVSKHNLCRLYPGWDPYL